MRGDLEAELPGLASPRRLARGVRRPREEPGQARRGVDDLPSRHYANPIEQSRPLQSHIEKRLDELRQREEDEARAAAQVEEQRRLEAERIAARDASSKSPVELFGDEGAQLCRDFLERVAEAGYPKAGRHYRWEPRSRGLLARVLRRPTRERVEFAAYAVGEVDSRPIFLCQDGRIRVRAGDWFEAGATPVTGFRRRYRTVKSHHLSGSGADVFEYEHHDEFVAVPLAEHLTTLLFESGAIARPGLEKDLPAGVGRALRPRGV